MSSRIGGMDDFFTALDKRLKARGIKVYWFFTGKDIPEPYLINKMNIFQCPDENVFNERLLKWVKDNSSADLFVGHFIDYKSRFPGLLRAVFKGRIVFVDHMSRPDSPAKPLRKLKNRIFGLLFYRKIDKIIAVSHFVKNCILSELGNFWDSKVDVVYNGCKVDDFHQPKIRPSEKSTGFKIFCIAHLIPEKGVQILIDACSILVVQKLNFKLIIAGEGLHRTNLESLAKKKLPQNQFIFTGSILEKAGYYESADLVVVPSLWREAFGLTIIEAMNYRKPLVASNIGGITEVLKDNDQLFEVGNAEDLAKKILYFYHNPPLRISKGVENHKVFLNKFTMDLMVEGHITSMKI